MGMGNEEPDWPETNEIGCEKTARTDVETLDAWTYILSELLNAVDEFKGAKRGIDLCRCP